MAPGFRILVWIIVALLVAVLFISMSTMRRQQSEKRDQTFTTAKVQHPVAKNPIIIGYILVPIIIVAIAALCLYFIK